ncbi:peptidoglycan DD-metalloendopeptidase family protein [Gordonia insulae]|uniref:Lysostaphin n=1 Tax=Gordonia insulae TaxID=2420509 RepID=A0A3G8JG73_9ACTN|nr:peptidoglycan DD-metalloendopeptidase family protein [Gordonia insulae]AZG43439.1 Lysostaphin [Gordonia insulae]
MRVYPLKKGTYSISSGFGLRDGGFHYGLDFAAKDGTPFYACQGGTVQYIGGADGYGQWIVIDSDDDEGAGCVEYGHMWDAFATGLKVGSKVAAGQLIGYVGSNGGSTGPHLHITVWERGYGGTRIDPAKWLAGRGFPGETTSSTPAKEAPMAAIPNPVTRTQISPNRHSGGRDVDWIVIHTQEGSGTAASITNYLCTPAAQVSYNAVCDDRETVLVVPWDQNPWSAMNANTRGDHILMAGSFAAWKRDKWLEPDARDGKNEDLQLTRTAALVAWRCAVRDIPIRYVGGKFPTAPGVCGHRDFGQWGGGHTDPGPNFPWDELISRATSIYNGGKDWLAMATMAEVEALIYKCLKVYVGPIGSDVKDIRQQLTGGRNAGEYGGFEQGGNRTLYDLVAAEAAKSGVPNTRDTLEGKK